jgi:hypothetical protein
MKHTFDKKKNHANIHVTEDSYNSEKLSSLIWIGVNTKLDVNPGLDPLLS